MQALCRGNVIAGRGLIIVVGRVAPAIALAASITALVAFAMTISKWPQMLEAVLGTVTKTWQSATIRTK